MGKRYETVPVGPPILNGFGQCLSELTPQVIGLRVASDHQIQPGFRQSRKQPVMPGRSAFRAGRTVAAALIAAGVTEPHRNYGDEPGVVERGPVYAHPLAQAVSARVVERQPAVMNAGSGRLSAHKNPRRPARLEHGARPKRQKFLANPALSDLIQDHTQRTVAACRRHTITTMCKVFSCSHTRFPYP